ncbi:hypothetical protein [Bdellovibrio sp. HCB2-146]|uniref:hypothetical protein n=1 Tax=Bdellovibrio sp. HCB2-146 TaxID=3394362 RepID=UPI0039BC94EA
MQRLAAVILLLFLFSPNARTETFKCNQFWPEIPDQNENCNEWKSFHLPKRINGSEMRIYHFADYWHNDKTSQEILETMANVMATSVPLFNRWFKTPSVYATLFNEVSADGTFSEQSSINPNLGQPCRISLFMNISENRHLAEQIGAHEIFHCIQDNLVFHKSSESRQGVYSYDWWIEGSANFFASYPFPEGGLDIQHGETYNPQEPLDRQRNPYSTVLFFDTLRQHFGMDYGQIGNLLKRQPVYSSFASERLALARWPGIDEKFFQFARHFANKDIRNVGGFLYNNETLPYGQPIKIEKDKFKLKLVVQPFTIGSFRIQVPSATAFKIKVKRSMGFNQRIRVSYRPYLNLEWKEPTTSASEFDVDCRNEDHSGIYDVLVTGISETDHVLTTELDIELRDSNACSLTNYADFRLNAGNVNSFRSPVIGPFW